MATDIPALVIWHRLRKRLDESNEIQRQQLETLKQIRDAVKNACREGERR